MDTISKSEQKIENEDSIQINKMEIVYQLFPAIYGISFVGLDLPEPT